MQIHLLGHFAVARGKRCVIFDCCSPSGLGYKQPLFFYAKKEQKVPSSHTVRGASAPLKSELIPPDKGTIIDFSCFFFFPPHAFPFDVQLKGLSPCTAPHSR